MFKKFILKTSYLIISPLNLFQSSVIFQYNDPDNEINVNFIRGYIRYSNLRDINNFTVELYMTPRLVEHFLAFYPNGYYNASVTNRLSFLRNYFNHVNFHYNENFHSTIVRGIMSHHNWIRSLWVNFRPRIEARHGIYIRIHYINRVNNPDFFEGHVGAWNNQFNLFLIGC